MSSLERQVAALTVRMDKAADFIREFKGEVVERLDRLEARVTKLEQGLGEHLREHQARDAANPPPKPRAPRVARTPAGKIRDPLMADLRARKADIGISVRQLAGLLGYPRNTVSNWLNRVSTPRTQEDRDCVQAWIDMSNSASAQTLREWKETV